MWTAPPLWSVPRVWEGERAFILCGGASLREQRHLVPSLPGRVIAIKEGVLLRPEADVAFFAGEHCNIIAPPLLEIYRGPTIIVRGKGHPVFPPTVKRLWRTTSHDLWSLDPTMVAGYDAGTSAINVAILYGVREIILLGYDMSGGRWFAGERDHPKPVIEPWRFTQHCEPLPRLAAHAARLGIRIVNCSPTSVVNCFERQSLDEVLRLAA